MFVGKPNVIVPATTFGEVTPHRVAAELPGWHQDLPPLARGEDVPIPPEVVRHALDPGESMVLSLALQKRASGDDVEVVLDDGRGRRAAKALGLDLVGTAGLILRAKAEGLLRKSERVEDVLNALVRAGMYLGPKDRAAIIKAADE